jgi:hypothetical protein
LRPSCRMGTLNTGAGMASVLKVLSCRDEGIKHSNSSVRHPAQQEYSSTVTQATLKCDCEFHTQPVLQLSGSQSSFLLLTGSGYTSSSMRSCTREANASCSDSAKQWHDTRVSSTPRLP